MRCIRLTLTAPLWVPAWIGVVGVLMVFGYATD